MNLPKAAMVRLKRIAENDYAIESYPNETHRLFVAGLIVYVERYTRLPSRGAPSPHKHCSLELTAAGRRELEDWERPRALPGQSKNGGEA